MYTEYANDPRMRANVGIRRRLAPLLENDRDQIELFIALLLSLPGSPVLYYGDEIGVPFPPIRNQRYLFTLPGHGFYWFTLPPPLQWEARPRFRPRHDGWISRRWASAVSLMSEGREHTHPLMVETWCDAHHLRCRS